MTKKKYLTKILQQQSQVYKRNPKGFNIETILKNIYRRDIFVLMIVPYILDYKATITIPNIVK